MVTEMAGRPREMGAVGRPFPGRTFIIPLPWSTMVRLGDPIAGMAHEP